MVEGGFAYGYLFMSQHKDTPLVFEQFLSLVRPERILEIGTFHGGLTLLLRDILDKINLENSTIRTYDINEQNFLKPLAKNRNIDIYTKNLFNETYTNFSNLSCEKEILEFVNDIGTTIVLCDGGCKKCEFNLVSGMLKKNDIIMAHDYAPNIEYFQKYLENKIWNWLEITDADIAKCADLYSLYPYCQDLMQQVAWCSRIRRSH